MSLRRAAAMIHAPPFSGIPFCGQEASAAVNASCIASSARSNEPQIRIRPARIRPDSIRKTASAVSRTLTIPRKSVIESRFGVRTCGYARHGADLDAAFPALARCRNARSPLDRLIQVLAVQDVVAGELLLRLGEGSVGDQRPSIVHAHGGSARGGRERLGAEQDTLTDGFRHQSAMGIRYLAARTSRLFL